MATYKQGGTLEKAYLEAESIMKHRAKSFHEAFKHLPRDRYLGVCALYAFNREADDLADDEKKGLSLQEKEEGLDALEERLQAFYGRGSSPTKRVPTYWPAFLDTLSRFQVPLAPLLSQLEGQRSDLYKREMDTFSDLLLYSRQVAGSVGLMLLPLLVKEQSLLKDQAFLKAAEDLGVAMQLTNILRDIGEDLRERQRIYLPKDSLAAHGLSMDTLVTLSKTPGEKVEEAIPERFKALFDTLHEEARKRYRAFWPFLKYFHESARMPLLSAALLYEAIGDVAKAAQYNVFTKRNYTDAWTRGKLLLKASALSKDLTS